MSRRFDLVLKGGTVVTPSRIERADVGVHDQRITAIGDLGGDDAAEVLDCRGLHVLPGVIDPHVHFREPGAEAAEDLSTGSAAAAMGGVVAVLEMPNTSPAIVSGTTLQDKLDRARGRVWVDHGFFVGATAENVDELHDLETRSGCPGIKVFMGSATGELLVSDDATLRRVMASGTRRMAIHAEDQARLVERRPIALKAPHPRAHPEWRDVETALKATSRALALSRETGRPIHILHLSTAAEVELIRTARRTLPHRHVTCEVSPQHLTFAAPECYDALGTFVQMNPPIREAHHREALWEAIRRGDIDCLASDHAPHTREAKARPYPHSPSGMPGVQTLVPVMLTHVARGRLDLQRFVELTSAGPARIWGMSHKGRIDHGYDADFTIVDLQVSHPITDDWIASRSGWTPFHDMSATGWPVATVVRGQVVMRDGALVGAPVGEPIHFTGSALG